MVDITPNGLSEGEISLKTPGVPVADAKLDKGCSKPLEFSES
jgi:hypothetical protein